MSSSHADIGDQPHRRTILCRHHSSAIIFPKPHVGHEPIRQEIDVRRTVTVHDNPLSWKRTTRWRGVAALATATAAAAAFWHSHQLNPMTFSADLDCSDLLDLEKVLFNINVLPWMSHVSDDFIAEGFRPDVRKIVPALDTADSQPVRFAFILQPQMRRVDVVPSADSMSMENVVCCFCVDDQHWLHCKTQVTHHAFDTLCF